MASETNCDEVDDSKPLTFTYVKEFLRQVEPEGATRSTKQKPRMPSGGVASVWLINRDFSMIAPVNKFDEVFPGIILSDSNLPMDKAELRRQGVTHMLNAAQGTRFNQVDTTASYYADLGLKFLGINAMDTAKFRLCDHFEPAAAFIHNAVTAKGRVVVHCHQGVSRSASLVLAYLMLHQHMGLLRAVRTVRRRRGVMPNDGFLKQLVALHNSLLGGDGAMPEQTEQARLGKSNSNHEPDSKLVPDSKHNPVSKQMNPQEEKQPQYKETDGDDRECILPGQRDPDVS